MKSITRVFSLSLLVFLLLDGLLFYITFMGLVMGREDFSIGTLIIFLFLLYLFAYISMEISKENIRKSKLREGKKIIKEYIFPSTVKNSLLVFYPFLTDDQREEVMACLRLFFTETFLNIHLLNMEDNALDIVSKEIDSELLRENFFSNSPSIVVNQAWKLFSQSEEYRDFSYKVFNMNFLYTPLLNKEESPTIELPNGNMKLVTMWQSYCEIEEIDPFFPKRMPKSFMLDETLNIPNGIKFKINQVALRESLDIEDAPSPHTLMVEIKKEKADEYLAKKLQYYLCNSAYCGLYQSEYLKKLLKKIQNNKTLGPMVLGTYTDAQVFMKKVLNHAAPPPITEDIGSSSGVSL